MIIKHKISFIVESNVDYSGETNEQVTERMKKWLDEMQAEDTETEHMKDVNIEIID